MGDGRGRRREDRHEVPSHPLPQAHEPPAGHAHSVPDLRRAVAGALGERGGEARPYYCDGRRADQKGGCERNRPEIRKMLPKGPGGASLDAPGNADRALVMSEANSELGDKLAWMAPMRAFAAAFGDDARAVLDALGMGAVGVDEPAPRGAARP